MAGGRLEALGAFPVPLPYRAEDGALRFLGVPPHARLWLEPSRDALAAVLVETAEERVTRIAWPFGDG